MKVTCPKCNRKLLETTRLDDFQVICPCGKIQNFGAYKKKNNRKGIL